MKILDTISFQSLFLIIAGVALFILLSVLIGGKQKTFRAAKMLNISDEEVKKKRGIKEGGYVKRSVVDTFFERTKILTKYAPYNVITEARSVEWKIGYKEYLSIVGIGAAILGGLFFIYWGKSLAFLYVMVFSIFTPRIALHYKRIEFLEHRRDRIAIFMKSVANSMSVFGNAIDSIEEVTPLVHESLRGDLVKAVALLKSGKSLTFSFTSLLEKYNYQDLHFFIDMLEVAHEHGGEYNDLLSNIADDFDQTKVLSMKLTRAMSLAKKAFFQNGIFVAILPIIFMFAEGGQLYVYLTTGFLNGILGKLVMTLNFCIILFFWFKMEQIAKFDLDS